MNNNTLHTLDPHSSSSPAENLAFHRLLRTSAQYRWWRPLIIGLVAIGFYLAFLLVIGLGIAIGALTNPTFAKKLDQFASESSPINLDLSDPTIFAVGMALIILLWPALFLANAVVARRAKGFWTSVTGRMRWGWLFTCCGIAIAIYGVAYLVMFIGAALNNEPIAAFAVNKQLPLMIVLILVLVPLQSATEEYIFRGYLMQTVGAWLRHPAWAILLPLPLFVFGHDYNLLGMLDVALFAAAAGWLSWRTGGLEAAIALHVINNCTLMLLGAVGIVDVNATGQTVIGFVISSAITVAFTIFVVLAARKEKIIRTLSPISAELQPLQ